MDRNINIDWKQLLVGILILVLVFEMVGFYVIGNPTATAGISRGPNQSVSTYVEGVANATVQISEYDPYIRLRDKAIDAPTLQAIRGIGGVEEVRSIQGVYMVALLKREDMEGVFRALRRLNLSPQVDAVIVLPDVLVVPQQSGQNATLLSRGGTIQQSLDYVLAVNENLNATMSVTGRSNEITGIQSLRFKRQSMILRINSTLETAGAYDTYSVPWGRRNEVDLNALRDRFNDSSIQYSRRSYVEFGHNLTDLEAAQVRKNPYITQVVDNRAVVQSNFTDEKQAREDLGAVTFPDSLLTDLHGHDLAVLVGVGGNRTYVYRATIRGMPEGYRWMADETALINSPQPLAINGTKTLVLKVEAIGSTVIKILEAEAEN